MTDPGQTGRFCQLETGVRHGCPQSPYLFILALANNIRNNKDIKRMQIDNHQIKICLLADDNTLIPEDLAFVKHVINTRTFFH